MYHQNMSPPYPPHSSNGESFNLYGGIGSRYGHYDGVVPDPNPDIVRQSLNSEVNAAASRNFMVKNEGSIGGDVKRRGLMRIERWIEGKGDVRVTYVPVKEMDRREGAIETGGIE